MAGHHLDEEEVQAEDVKVKKGTVLVKAKARQPCISKVKGKEGLCMEMMDLLHLKPFARALRNLIMVSVRRCPC